MAKCNLLEMAKNGSAITGKVNNDFDSVEMKHDTGFVATWFGWLFALWSQMRDLFVLQVPSFTVKYLIQNCYFPNEKQRNKISVQVDSAHNFRDLKSTLIRNEPN